MPHRIQEAQRMSDSAQAAMGAVTVSTLSASNLLAWASGFDAGAAAATITILGLAMIGLVTQGIKQINKARADAWADRMRLEMQIQQDREKIEAGSLNGQIKSLQSAIEEGNKRTADLQQRVEAANKKLHDAADERQVEVLRHHEEVQMLMKQLGLVTHELEESRQENRTLMARLDAKVQANTGAIDRIVSPDTGTQS